MIRIPARLAAAAVAASAVFVLGGCAGSPDAEPSPSAAASTPAAVEETGGAEAPDEDVLAERDAFMEEQQLPTDGTPLVATTDAQKQFIAEQSEYVESQGGTWTAEAESITLALAADACETSILNRHTVDATTFQTHVSTSPLFANLVPADGTEEERASAERNVASIMVFGTSFLCPDDAGQWEAAFTEAYSG
ncbi:MAG: hypothetical protein ACQEW8_02320 [Actinomycetota bacterium]